MPHTKTARHNLDKWTHICVYVYFLWIWLLWIISHEEGNIKRDIQSNFLLIISKQKWARKKRNEQNEQSRKKHSPIWHCKLCRPQLGILDFVWDYAKNILEILILVWHIIRWKNAQIWNWNFLFVWPWDTHDKFETWRKKKT